jgi:hypothetical protein
MTMQSGYGHRLGVIGPDAASFARVAEARGEITD